MGFLQTYKRLDNLCKDMNGVGVTGYINDMEQAACGQYRVLGWKDDYCRLKHCRYIRNKIVHENYAEESNMCSPEDSVWLDEFYQRILEQKDPLAVFYKVQASAPVHTKTDSPQPQNYSERSNKNASFSIFVLLAIAIIILIYFYMFVRIGG